MSQITWKSLEIVPHDSGMTRVTEALGCTGRGTAPDGVNLSPALFQGPGPVLGAIFIRKLAN